MTWMLTCTLLFCTIVFAVKAAIFFVDGPCPPGVKLGESWQYGECSECTCGNEYHGCRSCGKVDYGDKCVAKFNKSLPYSSCCEPTEITCTN